jgi:Leucine-rich repeat (LRR) protein
MTASTTVCGRASAAAQGMHPGRVTNLTLFDLNLTGQITPSVGNLTFLRVLDLSINHFSSQLPPLNRLIKLKYLFLSKNSLHENIQDVLIALTNYSELEWLGLSSNMLVGSIPQNIGSLSSLIALSLRSNSLTGIIPPTFSNITHLANIFLDDNQLEGSIPEELCQLHIAQVSLSSNRLSGRVPAAFFNQSSLAYLDLDMNALSGTLPFDIGDANPYLFWLSLGTNNLEGHIPASLGNASMLQHLDLSSNYFTGQIR